MKIVFPIILILLLHLPLIENSYSFKELFNVNEIKLPATDEFIANISLNESGNFEVNVMIYYSLEEPWMWDDIEVCINDERITIHLTGEHTKITKKIVVFIDNNVTIKLVLSKTIWPGEIYGNSTIIFKKINQTISTANQVAYFSLMVVAIVITIIPLIIQFIRRQKALKIME